MSEEYIRLESFDAVVRRLNKRRWDWINWCGLLRCFILKTNRFPSDHAFYPHKFNSTIATQLIGLEPKRHTGF